MEVLSQRLSRQIPSSGNNIIQLPLQRQWHHHLSEELSLTQMAFLKQFKIITTPFQNSGAPIFLFSKKAFDIDETFMRASRYIREIIPDTKIKFYSFS